MGLSYWAICWANIPARATRRKEKTINFKLLDESEERGVGYEFLLSHPGSYVKEVPTQTGTVYLLVDRFGKETNICDELQPFLGCEVKILLAIKRIGKE